MEDQKEIILDHDKLIDEIEARKKEEYARQSDAGESAAKVAKYLDETGLNGQAFGWLKTIMKKLPKKDGHAKAMDIILSLEAGLPMIKNHIEGQQGSLGLGDPADFEPEAPEEPEEEPEASEPAEQLDEEEADFEAHLAEVEEEESNVTNLETAAE